jgi:hypothetical protein
LHGSSYEVGLLELQRFLIQEQGTSLSRGTSYTICDPGTREQFGIAHAGFGSLARLLRRLGHGSPVPSALQVYETEDESLVFTVRRVGGLWGQRIEVYDADDHFIGYAENGVLSKAKGFRIYDRRGLPLAEVEGELQGGNFRFVNRDRKELGVVSRDAAAGSSEARTGFEQCLVSIHEDLAELPLAKMLLLGAALAITLVYYREGR